MAFALLSKTKRSRTTIAAARRKSSAQRLHALNPQRGMRDAAWQPQPSISATPPLIQTKFKVGAPNDKFEQEADRVADEVMRMPESAVANAAISGGQNPHDDSRVNPRPMIQPLCAECATEQAAPAIQRF